MTILHLANDEYINLDQVFRFADDTGLGECQLWIAGLPKPYTVNGVARSLVIKVLHAKAAETREKYLTQ